MSTENPSEFRPNKHILSLWQATVDDRLRRASDAPRITYGGNKLGYTEDPLVEITRRNIETLYFGQRGIGKELSHIISSAMQTVRPLLRRLTGSK